MTEKKRKNIVPFPEIASSLGNCSVDVWRAKKILKPDTSEDPKPIDLEYMLQTLPHHHLLSCDLWRNLDNFISGGMPPEIVNARRIREGLIEFTFKLSTSAGYGCRMWTVRVGGQGKGTDYITNLKIAPIAVRFVSPIAHIDIDDMGFVSDHFWSSIPGNPSLRDITSKIIDLLNGTLCVHSQDKYDESLAYTTKKVNVINQYYKMARHKTLVDDSLHCWDESWFVPGFVSMMKSLKESPLAWRTSQGAAQARFVENSPGIFSFDMLTCSFCDMFTQEIDNYEQSDLPRRRPNTMNNYGIIVAEIGMHTLMSLLLEKYLAPLAESLFPAEPVAVGLDHHHSFVVQYNPFDGDRGLDMHHDSSEITFNVCLGRDNFQGGDLVFCGHYGAENHRRQQLSYKHEKGRAVIHLGRHRHGASSVTQFVHPQETVDPSDTDQHSNLSSSQIDQKSQERLNLIMWMRSSSFRASVAYAYVTPDGFPRRQEDEANPPELCCLSKYNDMDYAMQLARINTSRSSMVVEAP